MLNNVILVGRITKDLEIVETDNYKRSYLTLAIPRNHKNTDGNYDVDFVSCVLWNSIAEHTCEYCKKGDIVGIKGRVETNSYEKDGETKYTTDIIAEKVTFLSTKKQDVEIEE